MPDPHQRFQDQHVVVTGGTRGLGRATSLAFLSEGARVHAVYRHDEAGAAALRDAAGADAARLELARLDVGDHDACKAWWKELAGARVTVLVNNAGVRRDGILPLADPDEWEAVLRTNLTGGAWMAKFAAQSMIPRRYGRIVFVTSPAGRAGVEGQTSYCASKAGQVGLVRALCKEVARRGVTVNAVSPGFVATDLLDGLPEERLAAYRESVPLRRFAEPEEVASAILYLASPEASYVTGAVLDVTGGL